MLSVSRDACTGAGDGLEAQISDGIDQGNVRVGNSEPATFLTLVNEASDLSIKFVFEQVFQGGLPDFL
jgi:hypothetical protein